MLAVIYGLPVPERVHALFELEQTHVGCVHEILQVACLSV
jgi:hypothetical protein